MDITHTSVTANEADTPSAKRVRVEVPPGAVPTSISKKAAASAALQTGLMTLHPSLGNNQETVKEWNTLISFILDLKKKITSFDRFSDNEFIPHSLRFKSTLKCTEHVAGTEEFQHLKDSFHEKLRRFQLDATAIMKESAKLDLQALQRQNVKMTARLLYKIIITQLVCHEASREPKTVANLLNTLLNTVLNCEEFVLFKDIATRNTDHSIFIEEITGVKPVIGHINDGRFTATDKLVYDAALKNANDTLLNIYKALNTSDEAVKKSTEISDLLAKTSINTAAEDMIVECEQIDLTNRESLVKIINDTVHAQIDKKQGNGKEGLQRASLKKKNGNKKKGKTDLIHDKDSDTGNVNANKQKKSNKKAPARRHNQVRGRSGGRNRDSGRGGRARGRGRGRGRGHN